MDKLTNYKRAKVPPAKSPLVRNGAHPFVRWVWKEINRQQCSQLDVEKRSGVSASAMRKWRLATRNPRITELEAVINALGHKLVIKVDND